MYGYTQPTELRAPEGIVLATACEGGYSNQHGSPHAGRLRAGLQVGGVYRFRAEGVPGYPGVAVYPTVELVDRLYPPPAAKDRFPLPIELTRDDLRLAAEGAFVTRVVYVEHPDTALPLAYGKEQPWFEAGPDEDPLVLATELGRPVAILRIGARDTAALVGRAYATPAPIPYPRDAAVRPAAAIGPRQPAE